MRMIWLFAVAIGLSFSLVVCNTSLAADTAKTEVVEPTSVTSSDQLIVKEEVEKEEEAFSGNVTFDFKDADIKNVLRLFSHKVGINIVAGSEVTGSVTIRLNDVPWEKALELILDVSGFAYVRDQNIIKVIPKTQVDKEQLKTDVFVINYASAIEVKASVEKILTERGKIQSDARSNSLIITDTPSNLYNIKKVIARLDSQTPQVLIRSTVVETNYNFGKDLGIKWSSLKGQKITIASPQVDFTDSFATVTTGTVDNHSVFTDGVQPDDIYGSVSTRNDRIYPDGRVYTGVTNLNKTLFEKVTTDTQDEVQALALKQVVRTAILSASDFEAVLSALQTQDNTDVISAPQIMTSDNRKAYILVGEQYPIGNFVFNKDTGRLEVQGFDYIDIGITLDVTPHINADGYITLDVHPTISETGALVAFAGATGTTVPRIITQKVDTRVVIKDRETLAIGGLIREKEFNDVSKVPVLGSIPIIGSLFRSKSDTKLKRNLLIFITPTIINYENSIGVTDADRQVFKQYQKENRKVMELGQEEPNFSVAIP